MAFGPSKGCAMLIVVRRSNAWSACSRGFKPILSKRADCRSPADGGVHAGGDGAVEKDDVREQWRGRRPLLPWSKGELSIGRRARETAGLGRQTSSALIADQREPGLTIPGLATRGVCGVVLGSGECEALYQSRG